MERTRTSTPTILGRGLWSIAAVSILALGVAALPAEPPATGELRGGAVGGAVEGAAPGDVSEGSSGWIVVESDNVSGVRPARQITNPASVRYEELLDATPEIQRMKREGISRESAQGQVLYAAAVDKVRRAATRVMTGRSHCSVWKRIRHSDGRAVPDITGEVRAEL